MADREKSAERVARDLGGISAETVRELAGTKRGELLREDQVTDVQATVAQATQGRWWK